MNPLRQLHEYVFANARPRGMTAIDKIILSEIYADLEENQEAKFITESVLYWLDRCGLRYNQEGAEYVVRI